MKSAAIFFFPVVCLAGSSLLAEVAPTQSLVGREVWVLPGTQFRVAKKVVGTMQSYEFGSFAVEKVQGEFVKVKGRSGWIYGGDTVFEQAEGRSTALYKVAHRCGKWEQEEASAGGDEQWVGGNWLNDEAMLIETPVSCQPQKVRTCVGPANCRFAYYEIEIDAEGGVKQDAEGKAVYQKLLHVSPEKEFAWMSCPVSEDGDCPATAEECRILNQADGVAFPKTSISGRAFPSKTEE